MLGLEFDGQVFEDRFLIADVVMEADFPTERWFWFDPPFNRGQSALLHKQPDNVWRIDFQLGWDADRERGEEARERRSRACSAMLGEDVDVRARMGQRLHLPVPAHGAVPPRPGALRRRRRAPGVALRRARRQFRRAGHRQPGLEAEAACIDGKAPESLLDSYDAERIHGADENILNSTRSTDFITPEIGDQPHLPRRGA